MGTPAALSAVAPVLLDDPVLEIVTRDEEHAMFWLGIVWAEGVCCDGMDATMLAKAGSLISIDNFSLSRVSA